MDGGRTVADAKSLLDRPTGPVRQPDVAALKAVTVLHTSQPLEEVDDAGADDATTHRSERELSFGRGGGRLDRRPDEPVRIPGQSVGEGPVGAPRTGTGVRGPGGRREVESPAGSDPVLRGERAPVVLTDPVVELGDLPPTAGRSEPVGGDGPERLPRPDHVCWVGGGLRRTRAPVEHPVGRGTCDRPGHDRPGRGRAGCDRLAGVDWAARQALPAPVERHRGPGTCGSVQRAVRSHSDPDRLEDFDHPDHSGTRPDHRHRRPGHFRLRRDPGGCRHRQCGAHQARRHRLHRPTGRETHR